MKKLKMLVIAVVLLGSMVVPVFAQDDGSLNNFVLINRTGYVIDQVYVSLTKVLDWEEDILGQDTLGNGEQVTIRFSARAETGLYDLKVVYDDGTEAIWEGLDLTQINSLSLVYDADEDVTSVIVE